MSKHIHVHIGKTRDTVENNSNLERANRMIDDIKSRAQKLNTISGEKGAAGGSIDNARRALSHIKDSVETALRLIG